MTFTSETAKIAGAKSVRKPNKEKFGVYESVMTVCREKGLVAGPQDFLANIMLGDNPATQEHPFLPILIEYGETLQKKPPNWAQLLVKAEKLLTREMVQTPDQVAAAKTLMEYMFAKKRSVEVKGQIGITGGVMLAPAKEALTDWADTAVTQQDAIQRPLIDITPDQVPDEKK